MMVWLPDSHHRAKASVKYNIDATVTNHDSTVLKFETLLMIQEPPVSFKQDMLISEKVKSNNYCCVARGDNFALMETKFNKNVFFSNECI